MPGNSEMYNINTANPTSNEPNVNTGPQETQSLSEDNSSVETPLPTGPREFTQNDRLNKKLLESLLNRMKMGGSNSTDDQPLSNKSPAILQSFQNNDEVNTVVDNEEWE